MKFWQYLKNGVASLDAFSVLLVKSVKNLFVQIEPVLYGCIP